ncbi:unnamed protein product [Somion occarium]|uniref:Chromosome segregation in meiosis protein n=1 Tax=Somion occarium TaxID=3059160 RepID=A0ABP1DBY0_9APHY
MTDLDSIWDLPVENSPPRRRSPSSAGPAKRSTLFLSDSEDEAPKETAPTPRVTKSNPDIDALFDDLDDEPDDGGPLFAPSLDVEALRCQADARNAKLAALTPHQILPSSSPPRDLGNEDGGDGGKKSGKSEEKKRKALPKLDEARLLSSEGFPTLIKEAKKFKPKGKGHETADLNRVLQMYQFWTQRMYPKMQFRDTVQRVEKLCHSKRMHVALSVWRDEAKGLINGRDPHDPIDLTSDAELDDSDQEDEHEKPDAPADGVSSRAASTRSSPAARPPSSASEPAQSNPSSDFDIDAMIEEDQEHIGVSEQLPPSSPPLEASNTIYHSRANGPTAEDDDEDMWNELDAGFDYSAAAGASEPTAGGARQVTSTVMEDDEDMWDMVREIEMEEQGDEGQVKSTKPTNDEGWDEMYI